MDRQLIDRRLRPTARAKRFLLCAAIAVAALALGFGLHQAGAQSQLGAEDGRFAAYRQLLMEANDRLSAALAHAQELQAEVVRLKAEAAKPKDDKPAPEEKK